MFKSHLCHSSICITSIHNEFIKLFRTKAYFYYRDCACLISSPEPKAKIELSCCDHWISVVCHYSQGTKVEKMLTLAPERYTAEFCMVAKIILWCI